MVPYLCKHGWFENITPSQGTVVCYWLSWLISSSIWIRKSENLNIWNRVLCPQFMRAKYGTYDTRYLPTYLTRFTSIPTFSRGSRVHWTHYRRVGDHILKGRIESYDSWGCYLCARGSWARDMEKLKNVRVVFLLGHLENDSQQGYLRDSVFLLKGSLAWDFWPVVFFMNQ